MCQQTHDMVYHLRIPSPNTFSQFRQAEQLLYTSTTRVNTLESLKQSKADQAARKIILQSRNLSDLKEGISPQLIDLYPLRI